MARSVLLSILVVPPPQQPLERFQALVIFYLKFIILFPIAVIWDKSYVLRHPSNPLPTIIAPPWSQDIYAYSITSEVRDYLIHQHPLLLRAIVAHQPHSPQPPRPTAAIFIEGDWHGPLLQPGIVVFHKRELLYVLNVPIATPSYPPIRTVAILSLHTDTYISLLSPQKFVARPVHYDSDLAFASSDTIYLSNPKYPCFLDV